MVVIGLAGKIVCSMSFNLRVATCRFWGNQYSLRTAKGVISVDAILVSGARVSTAMYPKIRPSNRSDSIGCMNFKCRGAAPHRSVDYRMKIASQQSDLARRADPVHKDTLIYRQRCRGGQLKETIIDQADRQRRVRVRNDLIVQHDRLIQHRRLRRAVALDVRDPLKLRDRADGILRVRDRGRRRNRKHHQSKKCRSSQETHPKFLFFQR